MNNKNSFKTNNFLKGKAAGFLKKAAVLTAITLQLVTALPVSASEYSPAPGLPSENLSQDLSWGVLAMNFDKNVYVESQDIATSLAVLDEKGMMVCDADLKLIIQRKDSDYAAVGTLQNGIIKKNPDCLQKEHHQLPDYESIFGLGEAGEYAITFAATTAKGTRSITRHLTVLPQEQLLSLPFVVQRRAPTRVYPGNPYPMTVYITAQQDYEGTVEESLPEGFTLAGAPDVHYGSVATVLEMGDSGSVSVKKDGGKTVISFPVKIKAGETAAVYYEFHPPMKSPEFYELGPLKVYKDQNLVFREPRSWNIANDSVNVKSGSFQKKTSNGLQSITGLGFQPKAIIFYWTNQDIGNSTIQTGAAGNNSYASLGMGFSTQTGSATSSRSVAYCSDSSSTNGANSDSAVRISSTYTITMLDGNGVSSFCSGTVLSRGSLISMDSDGFTLQWFISHASSTNIYYYAVGGSDVTNATSSTFTITNTTGTQAITGLGFQPDLVFYLSANTTTYDSTLTGARLGFGFSTSATTTQQAGFGMSSAHNVATAGTGVMQGNSSSTILHLPAATASAAPPVDADIKTWRMDANGFTINKTNAPAGSADIFYLAIKGGQYKVGSFDSPAATGTLSTTGVGFQPSGMFMFTDGAASTTQNTNSATAVLSLGSVGWATSSVVSATSSMGNIGHADANTDTNPDPDYKNSTTTLIEALSGAAGSPPAVNASATLISFDSDGFTTKWATPITTRRQILYWAIGSAENQSQEDYRWFANANSVTPGSALAATNTAYNLDATTTALRLRMNLKEYGKALSTNAQAFKLQFATTTTGAWTDVGATSSSVTWKYKDNSSATDGANISGALLGTTNVLESYVERNNTPTNPNTIAVGQRGEWDFALDPVNATTTTYYFRMVKSDGSVLDYYSNYPTVTIDTYYTQSAYRWYTNADAVQPSSAVASENATGTVATTSPVRLRMNVGVGSAKGLAASSQQFKLQFATSTGSSWYDVGATSTAGSWCSNSFCNDSWGSRRKITLNNASSTAVLTNHPVVFRFTSANIDYSKTQDSGQDIRFTDSSGNDLAYEIEKWDESATSTVWVKVPTITADNNTYLYIYYNNSLASSHEQATSTWDSRYKSVYHFETDPTVACNGADELCDSTATAEGGVAQGSWTSGDLVNGLVGPTWQFNGTDEYVDLGNISTFDFGTTLSFSVETWFKTPGGTNPRIISNGASGSNNGWSGPQMLTNGQFDSRLTNGGATVAARSTGTYKDDVWHHSVIVFDQTAKTATHYIDGQKTAITATDACATVTNNVMDYSGCAVTADHGLNTMISRNPQSSGEYFPGLFDEMRVWAATASPDQIQADYWNQSSTTAFTTIGSEEAVINFYDNASVSDGATVSSVVLSSSNVTESYEEVNPTALNPNALLRNQYGEWDFALSLSFATTTTYYFRMVKSDGSVLDAYSNYAALTITASASVAVLSQGGGGVNGGSPAAIEGGSGGGTPTGGGSNQGGGLGAGGSGGGGSTGGGGGQGGGGGASP